jgi:hypothetical protein
MIPALSVRQPWAWLIVNNHKPVENRSWPTSFRGRFLVHAGKTRDSEQHELASAIAGDLGIVIPSLDELDVGGLVGWSEIHDCVTECDSPWFVGEYGFLLHNSTPIPFVPFRGMLNFFNVPAGVVS